MIKLENGIILKEIPSSPNNDYMAGADGNIYSRTRFAGFGMKEYAEWYPLKGYKQKRKNGYVSITMCHKNKKVTKNVHRLICEAFHGIPNPSSLQVRHLDGDTNNNVPGNLCWGTQAENWMDRKAHGHGCSGASHPMAKFSEQERQSIKWVIENGVCSQRHLARVLGVSQSCIRDISLCQ